MLSSHFTRFMHKIENSDSRISDLKAMNTNELAAGIRGLCGRSLA